jgi:aminopeptidase N
MNLLNANSYQKGGWILHMLRREMGDTFFRKFIRTYYDRYKGTNADTDDLEKIAEEVSKKDLHQFFKQWLYTPGIPQLNIRWLYNEKDKTVAITIEQIQKQMLFEFPLQIRSEGDKSEIFTLNITKRTETFSIPASSTIRNISADPNTVLLFDSRIEKINP